MTIKRISVDLRDKTLNLQFTFVWSYLQTYMIPEDLHASVFFTNIFVKLLRSVVWVVQSVSKTSVTPSQVLQFGASPSD